MISAISVKDRLKKQAIEEKKTMQDKAVLEILISNPKKRLRRWL